MTTLSLPQLSQKPNRPRSTRGKWRAMVLIGVHLIIVAHVVHWQMRGETLGPVEPSESTYALRDGILNVGTIFFAVALLSTLLLGRFVCGWLCHFVAVQDLSSWLLAKVGIRPKPFRSRLLLWAPLCLAVYLFVWQPLAPRFFDDAPVIPKGGLQASFTTEGLWDTFPPLIVAIPFFLICGCLTIYFLGAKGFCTYACPYGGFFAPIDRASPVRIVVDPDKCQGTGHCTAVCTSNVRVHQEVADYGKVIDQGCMKCMDCVSACPNDALSLGIARPALFTKRVTPEKSPRWLPWGEDIAAGVVFLVVFVCTFRAYGPNLFPLLFAAGIAACAAPIGAMLWRMPKAKNMRFARIQLKRAGKTTLSGIAFAVIALLLGVVTVHTGVMNYHRWRVDIAFRAFAEMGVPTQAFFGPQAPVLTPEQRETFEDGVTHASALATIDLGGTALLFNEHAIGKAATLQIALGNFEESENAFRIIDARSGIDDLRTETRAQLLVRTNRPEDALDLLGDRLPTEPTFWRSREVYNRIMSFRQGLPQAVKDAERAVDAMAESWKTREARAQTHKQIALMKRDLRDGEGALEAITAAALIAPDNVNIGEFKAVFMIQINNDVEGAIAEMYRLVGVAPDDAGLRYRFAQLGVRAQRPELVREQGEAFLELQKENDEAQGLVDELYRQGGVKGESD